MQFCLMVFAEASVGVDPPPTDALDDRLTEESYLQHQIALIKLSGFWTKIGLLTIATAVISVTLCLVVCAVGKGCYINSLIRKYQVSKVESEKEKFETMKKNQMILQKRLHEHRKRMGVRQLPYGRGRSRSVNFGKTSIIQENPHNASMSPLLRGKSGDEAGDWEGSLQGFTFGYGTQDTPSSSGHDASHHRPLTDNNNSRKFALMSTQAPQIVIEEDNEMNSPPLSLTSADASSDSGPSSLPVTLPSQMPEKDTALTRIVINRKHLSGQRPENDPEDEKNLALLHHVKKPDHLKERPHESLASSNPTFHLEGATCRSIEGAAFEKSADLSASKQGFQPCEGEDTMEPVNRGDTEHQDVVEGSPHSAMSISSTLTNLSLSLSSALSMSKRTESKSPSPEKPSPITRSSTGTPPTTPSSTSSATGSLKRISSSSASRHPTISTECPVSQIFLSFCMVKKVSDAYRSERQDKRKPRDQSPQPHSPQELQPQELSVGLLSIKVENVTELSPRNYSSSRDPFVHLTLVRDRRSLRKKSSHIISEFQTTTIKHSLNPTFNETFTAEIQLSELKYIRLKIEVFDADRHTKTTAIAATSIQLKEIRALRTSENPITTFYHLTPKKQQFGQILFGLTYLPTAQRLSFSVIKASDLMFEELVAKEEDFRPYVRIIQIDSRNGKVLRKKKTGVKYGTKDPEFNETLNFDVSPETLSYVVFLVIVSHRSVPEEQPDDCSDTTESGSATGTGSATKQTGGELTYITPRELLVQRSNKKHSSKNDPNLGTVCLGQNVMEERERMHWLSVVMTPRKVFSMWQTIY